MIGDAFLHYLFGTDCLLKNRRLYNIVFGNPAIDFAEFRGMRFGLVPGPYIEELTDMYKLRAREELESIIDAQLVRSDVSGRTLQPVDVSDSISACRLLAYEVAKENSLQDVLNRRHVVQRDQPGIADIAKAKEGILEKLDVTLPDSIVGQGLVFLGSSVYPLEKSVQGMRNPQNLNVRWRGQNFFAIPSCRNSGQELGNAIDYSIRSQISSLVSSRDVRSILQGGISRTVHEVILSDDHYEAEHNIGFKTAGSAVYAYTWTPAYVLLERVTNRYYRFPPAQVGVRVFMSQNTPQAENPVVMNRYKHPALQAIDGTNGRICFMNENTDFSRYPIKDRIAELLHKGCCMLMRNYVSAGGAYFNLEEPHSAEKFSDLLVNPSTVRAYEVTNLRKVQHYRRTENDA